MSVFYGSLADSYGRRPILALGLTGEALALVWVLTVCQYYFERNIRPRGLLAERLKIRLLRDRFED
jgi:MFS family permease